jgi:hypothetical protein
MVFSELSLDFQNCSHLQNNITTLRLDIDYKGNLRSQIRNLHFENRCPVQTWWSSRQLDPRYKEIAFTVLKLHTNCFNAVQ